MARLSVKRFTYTGFLTFIAVSALLATNFDGKQLSFGVALAGNGNGHSGGNGGGNGNGPGNNGGGNGNGGQGIGRG